VVVSLSTTEGICFDEIIVAAASNHKVLHLVSVISVSITGKGCRYFQRAVFIICLAHIGIL
jgi:hypothetical protein